ncbi:imidazole glycerol phosphate synthase subunit HisF [Lachnospiraceae bacterium]|nr:imidazole glycerol phosphate synthase subunit HisF [Lachnospiraceae bacterium]
MMALKAFPGGLQLGGGITAENAAFYLEAGASHVIVTSYVFRGGEINWGHMERLRQEAGKEHVVIDVSCRRRDGDYYIVTDRWQKYTNVKLSCKVLKMIEGYCDEFLIHGVDVEGRASGIDENLAALLKDYEGLPVTYAGGIGSMEDLERFRLLTGGKIDFTVGSALDLFGGRLPYDKINGLN